MAYTSAHKQARPQRFQAPWWLPDGHTQTLWRKFAASPAISGRSRQRVDLPDGDFIDLDWCLRPEPPAEQNASPQLLNWLPIVVIVHGLCGCSESHYVLALQQQLGRRGYSSAAMNLRGCSGTPNLLARAYHSGATEDLDAVLLALQKAYPQRQFCFVGYSLGANLVLKWLGEKPSSPRVAKAVAVSTPFSLAACAQEMVAGSGRLYGRYFLSLLLQSFRRKRQSLERQGNWEEVNKLDALGPLDRLRNIWEFDDQVTAALHGFSGAEDYYQRCSCRQFIADITVPTLLLSSANDPLIPSTLVPAPGLLPDPVKLELWSGGGHVGFRSNRDSKWLEKRIIGFLDS
ncbi:MAG: alpha/beta fold hydrolase [Pseudomonadales bacterium]|nr:alpha/beta fold hydrolase [Pseudomonadales bacterium]